MYGLCGFLEGVILGMLSGLVLKDVMGLSNFLKKDWVYWVMCLLYLNWMLIWYNLHLCEFGSWLVWMKMDSLSIVLLVLGYWLGVQCTVRNNGVFWVLWSLLLVLVGLLTEDLIWLFMSLEGLLFPVYFWLMKKGSRLSKLSGGSLLLGYTGLGGLFYLGGTLVVYWNTGSTSFDSLLMVDEGLSFWLWMFYGMAFGTKLPLMPFHMWLTEAHVEASTEGSMFLAGMLLKMGGYGFISLNVEGLGVAIGLGFYMMVYLGVLTMVMASATTLVQTNLKSWVAYGSMSHMGMVLMGLVVGNEVGYMGGIMQMMSHGMVSSGLFLCVGLLYEYMGTKNIWYLTGLSQTWSYWVFFFLVFCLGNVGLPFTSGFVGEFGMLLGLVDFSLMLGLWGGVSMFLVLWSTKWVFLRLVGGNTKLLVYGMGLLEFSMLCVMGVLVVFLGMFPGLVYVL